MKIRPAVRPGRRIEKKGKDRTVLKSHKVVIIHLFGEKPPINPIETKTCVVGNLADVITCAKFQDEIFRSYNFTRVEFPIFLLIFAWALQQQRYCATCDVSTMQDPFVIIYLKNKSIRRAQTSAKANLVRTPDSGSGFRIRMTSEI